MQNCTLTANLLMPRQRKSVSTQTAKAKYRTQLIQVVQEWTGIMGATVDGRPFVGGVPGHNGLWISAGFNGHGMVLCMKSAEALVKMIHNDGKMAGIDWFPESFLISEKRLKARFNGRTDMLVPESKKEPIAD